MARGNDAWSIGFYGEAEAGAEVGNCDGCGFMYLARQRHGHVAHPLRRAHLCLRGRTNPLLPGLELHLPANTVITDRYGKIVHRISITPVPIPKPPFPLPAGVQVPIYFTIQPGGAYIKVLNSGSGNSYAANGARLFYPNSSNLRPGTPFQFWNYDAAVRGWYIYGQGQVAPNGANIVPDPGVKPEIIFPE